MAISIHDRTTPLEELAAEFGWDSSPENLESLVLVLCQRLAECERQIDHLAECLQAEQERPRPLR